MRITSLLIAVVFLSVTSFAQDLTSKKGENFLPEEGEWAIGFDATPFLEYVGNFLGDDNSAPVVGYLNGVNTIYGKMYTSPTEALRAKARIGFTSSTDKAIVTDVTDVTNTVEDERKVSSTIVGLGLGKEYRRGNTRLQGLYGAEAFLWMMNTKTTYGYGNALGSANTLNTNVFKSGMDGFTEVKSGSTIGVQLRGFVGAEYFIFPKISLGAEYGWGLTFASTGNGESTFEFFNTTDNNVESTTTETAGGSSVSLDSDINNSSSSGLLGSMNLKMLLHF